MKIRISPKADIKQAIEQFLFHLPRCRLHNKLVDITNKNNELSFLVSQIFRYKGARHTPYDWVEMPKCVVDLHPVLHQAMDEYLAEFAELEKYEIPMCMGYVQNVLNSSKSPADYLQLLPTALHKPIQAYVDKYQIEKTLSLDNAAKLINANVKSVEKIKYRLMMNLLDSQ